MSAGLAQSTQLQRMQQSHAAIAQQQRASTLAAAIYTNTSTTSTTTSTGTVYYWSTISSASTHLVPGTNYSVVQDAVDLPNHIAIDDGRAHSISMPDGTTIQVQEDGSFQINDAAAKVIYRANRIRDFNPFLNASDKLESFIRFCGEQGVRQGDVLGLPINLFIAWLVIEAAKADREPEPDVPLIPDLRRQTDARCLSCGRFISPRLKQNKIEFCRTACFDRRFATFRGPLPELTCREAA